MHRMWQGNGRVLALGVGLGVAVSALLGAWQLPVARAQPSGPSTETSGTIAFTSAGQNNSTLLFLVDTREKAFAVYRVDPTKGAVKLEASRPYRYDLKLEYNNLPPEVAAVEAMVASTGRK